MSNTLRADHHGDLGYPAAAVLASKAQWSGKPG
jgi:hypothetical protein